ncbi:MAG: Saccharopine dehydrogenase [NADP, L-glutamate-forming] [uncultured Adhaeribacter sp.]|uniref:Saccharopine dehydrogenase [NADP, L-glutamate-forming] n=1 Tax=uncultured Adhaeribacter sp. TaxID=448109 RepID=A0A6J4HV73_9BACT|nr:MAG: Saccharopine dehydrogenase [NADP, L-glutamate-forming] [uncultured Adhaeribacter sp.]
MAIDKSACMKHILLFGAGRSSRYLIEYLMAYLTANPGKLIIGDLDTSHLRAEWEQQPAVTLVDMDINDNEHLRAWVSRADLVISLLPVSFHRRVAEFCLNLKKHFLSASYVSPEMQALHDAARQQGLLFLMEMGLDPGLDHMSAMAAITDIRAKGGNLLSFKSYTGGLVSPESDDNPWHYKIAWNPRNIVLAGQGVAKYLFQQQPKYVSYPQLFRHTELLEIAGAGWFEGYPNRDSLSYRQTYQVPDIPTILRGTLRRPGFCAAWQHLVQLGLTDDSYVINLPEKRTYRQWFVSFLPPAATPASLENRLAHYLNIPLSSPTWELLRYLDLWADESINLESVTPARILEQRLLQKLPLQPQDKDMVVMQHLFEYTLGAERRQLKSSLVVQGENAVRTAMAKTVGLPLAIGAKLILENKVTLTGVQIPTKPAIYLPILAELKTHGIQFGEEEGLLG